MRVVVIIIFFLQGIGAFAQNINFDQDPSKNLYIRLYGNIDYNQKIEPGIRNYGKLDVHRIVTLFGYQFSRSTQFVAEIEVEHVEEIFIEQAWVKHKIDQRFNVKAGLLLVPMGFINEQHEPTFFYSVERPLTDQIVIPTTWREIGAGFTGLFSEHSIRYQLYAINSFLGYNGASKFSAAKGLRSGRQKGAESLISGAPSISAQVEYFGIDQFKVALSGFYGETNTTLGRNTEVEVFPSSRIDSTTVDLSMVAIHSSYNKGQWSFRGQYALANLGRVEAYNSFTGANAANTLHGGYLVVGYDFIKKENKRLSPFFRFEHVNTQLRVTEAALYDGANKQNVYTLGLNYAPENGVVFKLDFQRVRPDNGSNYSNLNTSVGVWF